MDGSGKKDKTKVNMKLRKEKEGKEIKRKLKVRRET
jgi:hypothetical protein